MATTSIATEPGLRHRELAENERPRMAKANLPKAEENLRPAMGAVIQRAAALLGWSLKELAGKVDRDPRQVARWIGGQERAPFDLLWSVAELRQPLVVAFAEICNGVEVVTEIRVRRTA